MGQNHEAVQLWVLHTCFVDLRRAFDTVPRGKLWNTLRNLNVPTGLIRLVQILYQHCKVRVQVGHKLT